MLILCGLCGADITERPCTCRKTAAARSTLLDVCLTATAIRGHVDGQSIREAVRLLEERPS